MTSLRFTKMRKSKMWSGREPSIKAAEEWLCWQQVAMAVTCGGGPWDKQTNINFGKIVSCYCPQIQWIVQSWKSPLLEDISEIPVRHYTGRYICGSHISGLTCSSSQNGYGGQCLGTIEERRYSWQPEACVPTSCQATKWSVRQTTLYPWQKLCEKRKSTYLSLCRFM